MKDRAECPNPAEKLPRFWSKEEKEQWIIANDKVLYRATQSYRSRYEEDDLIQTAREATLKAFEKYDPSKSSAKLSTYVYSAVINELNMLVRGDTAQKRQGVLVSFDTTENDDGSSYMGAENKDTSDTDWLHQPQISVERAIESKEACDYIRKIVAEQLTEPERIAFRLSVNGVTQVNIGKHIGCSQAKVSALLKMARIKIILELRRAGFELNT